MQIVIDEYEKGKFQLIGTFEVGNSGHYEQRILVSKLSKKKAEELAAKYGTNGVRRSSQVKQYRSGD